MPDEVRSLRTLIEQEIEAKRLEGCDVWALEREFVVTCKRSKDLNVGLLRGILAQVEALRPAVDWPYLEPDTLEAVRRQRTEGPRSLARGASTEDVSARLEAGWLGMVIGATMGYPLRGCAAENIAALLDLPGMGPLKNYLPPELNGCGELQHRHDLRWWLRASVDGAPRSEWVDLALCSLTEAARTEGPPEPAALGALWLARLPYAAISGGNAAAYRNLISGFAPPETGRRGNPFRQNAGAALRGCLWGMIYPARPEAAAACAFRDAVLSHTGCGLYLAMWTAALTATAFVSDTPEQLLSVAGSEIPRNSRLAEAVRQAVEVAAAEPEDWQRTPFFSRLRDLPDGYSTAVAAKVAFVLVEAAQEFDVSVGRACTMGGATDTTAAIVGTVLGIAHGPQALPEHLTAPLKGRVRSAIAGADRRQVSEAAADTAEQVARRAARQRLPI